MDWLISRLKSSLPDEANFQLISRAQDEMNQLYGCTFDAALNCDFEPLSGAPLDRGIGDGEDGGFVPFFKMS